jgi:hypothetical protein
LSADRWHGAWRARVEATARLAACITRKRVAFTQFKAWYWQCFDENVQVRRIKYPAVNLCLSAAASLSAAFEI